MQRYQLFRFLHLFWAFPLYLLFISGHQALVYKGMNKSLNEGKTYQAQVVDAQIKRIASQSNGWVILKFQPTGEAMVEQKLGLPVNIASKLMLDPVLEVAYLKDSFIPIVIKKTADVHIKVVLINLSISVVSTLFVMGVMVFVSRFAERKYRAKGQDELQIIRTA